MLTACPDIHCLRDATRGGVATVLNEFAQSGDRSASAPTRDAVPVREAGERRLRDSRARSCCTGERGQARRGRAAEVCASAVLAAMRAHPAGETCCDHRRGERRAAGVVVLLRTVFGGERIVDMLVGEQLPRIC